METYYHINKNDCSWKIGDEIDLGKEDNYLWRSFAHKGDSIIINGKTFDVFQIAREAINVYIGKYPPNIEMKGYHFNPLVTLNETIDSLGNSIKVCRELAFELIRSEFYPELPSRKKCIWLIAENEESLKFWKNVIQSEHRRIFKVNVDGKVHRAAQKWIEGGTFSIETWNALAHNYWKGEDSGSIEDEILYEGKFTIVDEIDPE